MERGKTVDALIYDLGMHRGEDSEFYLAKGFTVVAVEANSDLCKIAEERLASYAQRLRIINAAIHDTPGTTTFYVNDKVSVWGTTRKEWAERNERLGTHSREVTVPAVPLQNIISEHGMPYYLKIDIEGADTMCLDALRHFTDRPPFLSIESAKTFDDVFLEMSKLWELGYRRFNLVAQHTVPKQVCPNPAREGVYVQHRFAFGSSGLFGRELPGEWLTLEESFRKFHWILRRNRLLGDDGVLRRWGPVRAATNLDRTARHMAVRKAYRAVRSAIGAVGLRPSHYDTHAMLG